MNSRIENKLRKLSEEDPNLNLLLGQWEFDRKLISQALQNVGQLFPHYSLHDASHSEVILANIGRMLGEEGLDQLSGSDLWLLLESAYLHDAGMIATAEKRKEDLQKEDFKSFLVDLANENSQLGESSNELLELSSLQEAVEIEEKYRHLLIVYSEYVRKEHAKRSEKVVHDPYQVIGSDSPRNEIIIPQRFWHLIGKICKGHGEDREFVMREIPYQESGIGEDFCHPRFIAVMLRLGDLLDLDSNRFCPVLNNMLGQLPEKSEAHKKKHKGVDHLLISQEKIEVTSEHEKIDSYLEASKWFDWLKNELESHILNWNEINPKDPIRGLPSPGKIEARLKDQVIFNTGERPQLELDKEKLLEIVQGANIYNGPHDAIRELIQNSIDASLLMLSYNMQKENRPQPKNIKELESLLGNYPININIQEVDRDQVKDEEGFIDYYVEIKDKGIGIRYEDLKFILKLGSSKDNKYRKKIEKWLPEWARPSGTFGIGFHSIFNFVEEVTFKSRHQENKETYQLEFQREKSVEPRVIVKEEEHNTLIPPSNGTSVNFHLKVPSIPGTVRFDDEEIDNVLRDYDFVTDRVIPYTFVLIKTSIKKMSNWSLCPINFNGVKISKSQEEDFISYFDNENGIELKYLGTGLGEFNSRFRFKGAIVKKASFPMALIATEINLHEGDASDFLEISRNDLTKHGNKIVSEKLNQSIKKFAKFLIDEERDSLNEDDIQIIDLFKEVFDDQEESERIWENLLVGSKAISLKEVLEYNNVQLCFEDEDFFKDNPHDIQRNNLYLEELDSSTLTIKINRAHSFSLSFGWLFTLLKDNFNSITLYEQNKESDYLFNNSKEEFEVKNNALIPKINHNLKRGAVGCRNTIPCPDRFQELGFRENQLTDIGWGLMTDKFIERLMPSPIVYKRGEGFSIPNICELVYWIHNKSDSQRDFFQIVEKMKEFLEVIREHHNDNDAFDLNEKEINQAIAELDGLQPNH